MARSWFVGVVVIFGVALELWFVHILLNLPPQLGFLLDAATIVGLIALLIDERNKMSLSRLQVTVWSVIILCAIASIGLSRVEAGVEDPLAIAIPEELLWVLGITGTALVGTPLIQKVKADAAVANPPNLGPGKAMLGRLVVNTTAAGADWTDIFMGEEASNSVHLDVGKVQMFYFTAIAALVYALSVLQALGAAASSIDSLPALSSGFVALLGLSNGAYLANKAVPRP
jgi:hypothetical protein